MKPKIRSYIAGLMMAVAAVASACGSTDSSDDASPLFEPTVPATQPDVAPTPTTTTQPIADASTVPIRGTAIEGVGITIDEIGVSTVVPRGWVKTPEGTYSDGVSHLGVLAIETSSATDPALDGFAPLRQLEAGGHTWSLYTADHGNKVTGLGYTEIGAMTYGIVLEAPAELAEHYLETIVTPALESFEVSDGAGRWPPGVDVASVDIDGHSVAYLTGGSGSATVVFEAGLGNGMASWALVAPDVAEIANVFAYDRPGYGASDLTDKSRDGAAIVADLRELLVATGHEPPYVLVGHSLGGTLMDLYARTHPDEVAALVLVDSRHHDFTSRCIAQFDAVTCDIPTDIEIERAPRPMRDEWLALELTVQQRGEAPTFPEVPLVVITAGIAEGSPLYTDLWRQTQQDYADMVSGSRLIIAERSGHGIPIQQPKIIIDTIADLVREQN